MISPNQFCGRTRREFLWQTGGGFAGAALAGMMGDSVAGATEVAPTRFTNPMAAKASMKPAKAKAVIFLFMYGGPSQVETFDYKPALYPLDGKTITVKTFGRGGHKNEGRVVGPKWKFKQYGQCGKYVSDLFPNVGTCVDDIGFVHSMYAESPIHGSAMLMMNAGRVLSGYPCLGSWVTYGLGSVNENMPGFVVMLDKTGGPISGPKNWASGFMPAAYQGVVVRADKTPIHDLALPPGMTRDRALGAGDDLAHSSIRFGIGRFNTEAEIDYVIDIVVKSVEKLRSLSPLWEMHLDGIDINSIQWTPH